RDGARPLRARHRARPAHRHVGRGPERRVPGLPAADRIGGHAQVSVAHVDLQVERATLVALVHDLLYQPLSDVPTTCASRPEGAPPGLTYWPGNFPSAAGGCPP